jgi:hypothetical protein
MSTISGMNIVVQQVDAARDMQTQKDAATADKQLQAAQNEQEEKLPTKKVQESEDADQLQLNQRRQGQSGRQERKKKKQQKKRSGNAPHKTSSGSGKLLDTIA